MVLNFSAWDAFLTDKLRDQSVYAKTWQKNFNNIPTVFESKIARF